MLKGQSPFWHICAKRFRALKIAILTQSIWNYRGWPEIRSRIDCDQQKWPQSHIKRVRDEFRPKKRVFLASKNLAPKKPLWWTEAKKVEKSPKSPKNHIIRHFEASCHLGSSFESIGAKSGKIDLWRWLGGANRGWGSSPGMYSPWYIYIYHILYNISIKIFVPYSLLIFCVPFASTLIFY